MIDGVAAAVILVEGLVRLDLQTSRHGTCAPPRPKSVTGFPDLARAPVGGAG